MRTVAPNQSDTPDDRNTETKIAMDTEDTRTYRVVINHEEQYSIWPADRELPLGWNDAGFSGDKAACLRHIEEVWTDMRPLSLRKRMQEDAP